MSVASPKRKPKRAKPTGNPWPEMLVKFRTAKGTGGKPMPQTAAAALLGVSAATWIAWENSQRVPSGPAAALLRAKFPKHF